MATSSNSSSGDLNTNTDPIQCPKCNGVMVQGFIVDWYSGGTRRVSNWAEGAPVKSTWLGMSFPAKGEKYISVGTFRCSVCGFLESYARPEFAAK
jgi:hypothetical protein